MNPLEIIQAVFGEEYEFGEKELSTLYEVVKLATRNRLEWQPIETAPKVPFKNVLLWDGQEASLGFFFPEYVPRGAIVQGVPGCWEQAYTLDTIYATHWMPLPEPPEEE